MIKQNIFTQFPSWITTYPKLTHFQFRLYTLLEYYRFTQTNPTTDEIANDLSFLKKGTHKSFRDFIRKELRQFNNIFPNEFLSIHFKRSGIGLADKIIIHFNYINKEIKIHDSQIINLQDQNSLSHFLKNSKYFSCYNASEIIPFVKADFENLLKALIYIDTRKEVKEPLRYLRSCFKNNVFKYDKKEFELEKIEVEKEEYHKRLNKLAKIDSPLLYGITYSDLKLLDIPKSEQYIFYGIKDKNHILIYRTTYKTKEANTKNVLSKYKIPHQIFLRNK